VSAAPLLFGSKEDPVWGAEPGAGERRHLAEVPNEDGRGEPDRPLTVLLVEDDPAMRMVCQVNLESEGFHVLAAERAMEALTLAESERPDVVLLDVMLPDLGGFEVAARLPGLPVVFLSARGSEHDLEQGRRAGAIDYVMKPFDPVELASRLRADLDALARTGSPEEVWEMRFGPPPETDR
jgi:DNA-binding response OmpR family regulator